MRSRIPLIVNGDITSFEKAVTRSKSGADAVMIGRGAQGQPWLPGQIGRRLDSGTSKPHRRWREQLGYIRALYDEVCSHYGLRIGLRHARKHLGWALDVAALQPRAGRDDQGLAATDADIRGSGRRASRAARCIRRLCMERCCMT